MKRDQAHFQSDKHSFAQKLLILRVIKTTPTVATQCAHERYLMRISSGKLTEARFFRYFEEMFQYGVLTLG